MSRYPEADEAQRRHYNDGYNPYPPPNATPNPYDTYDQPNDPRVDPYASQPTAYNPVPLANPYGAPRVITSPPLPQEYSSYPPQPGPPIAATPNSQYGGGFDFHDDNEDRDTGDMPLLRRDASDASRRSGRNVPGAYDDVTPDDRSESNIRYGRIPQRVPRRYKTIKKVALFHGNFVLDSAVPSKLLARCKLKNDREFTHMHYTAATCDPNDFKDSGFTLRQVHYETPRRTELFIVMTMYNEGEDLFTRTMHGVMKNIAHLCTRERSKTWGKEGWKKVVVCIVSDGRSKINARTLSVIAAMGIYQEGVAKNVVNGKPVTAHIYEYTTQGKFVTTVYTTFMLNDLSKVSVTPSMKIEGSERDFVPVQVIFCLKEKNQKKINSHRWFFNAFGPILQPNVCILLDVGTEPGPKSIYSLWKAFDINSNVGGACGEIVALKGKYLQNLINPLVAAQNFEYKMSNILDKPLESVFGYITVLPGAFSAYRYIALQNDSLGEGPLQKYFLGETMHGAGADIFTANMYLAEDRILCWELVSKRGGSWILYYVKSAYAVTDVPDQVPELISQRRRWLNGSFFAAVNSVVHFYYIYRSAHTFTRKFWIHVEMIYQLFNLIFSWFALANYYIAFVILSQSMEDPSFKLGGIRIVNVILEYFYLGLLIMCFILSLGNRPQGSKWGYTMAFVGFALITIYMTIAAFLLAIKGIQNISEVQGRPLQFSDIFVNRIFRNIVLSILATLGLYVLASIIFFEPWHMITSFVQYLLMAPSYINVLNVYAFANVHDISWGTKGDNKISTDLGVVTTGKNKDEVEVVVPTTETDIDAAYEDALLVFTTKAPKEEQKVDPSTQQEDFYKGFRTKYYWHGLLAMLCSPLASSTGKASNKGAAATVTGYMSFLLFSVAGLALIRFIGSTSYMIVRLFTGA